MRNISLHSSWTCHIKLSITYQPVSHRRGPIIILRNIIYKDFNVPQKFCFWRLRHLKDLSSFIIDNHRFILRYRHLVLISQSPVLNFTYDALFNLIGLKNSIHRIFSHGVAEKLYHDLLSHITNATLRRGHEKDDVYNSFITISHNVKSIIYHVKKKDWENFIF